MSATDESPKSVRSVRGFKRKASPIVSRRKKSPETAKATKRAKEQGNGSSKSWVVGGRWDIANATKKIAEKVNLGELEPSDIDESTVNLICNSFNVGWIFMFFKSENSFKE